MVNRGGRARSRSESSGSRSQSPRDALRSDGGHLPQSSCCFDGHMFSRRKNRFLMTRQRFGGASSSKQGVALCCLGFRSRSQPPLFSALHQFQPTPWRSDTVVVEAEVTGLAVEVSVMAASEEAA